MDFTDFVYRLGKIYARGNITEYNGKLTDFGFPTGKFPDMFFITMKEFAISVVFDSGYFWSSIASVDPEVLQMRIGI